MAITAAHKSARGYELQPNREFQHVSEGTTPKLPKGEVATYLPVVLEDKRFNEWYVIKAGTIIARDSDGKLVFANGGSAATLTYTANDVDYTVDIDEGSLNSSSATLVAAAGSASTTLAANYPIGWAPYHYYSGTIRLLYAKKNYDLQPDVATLNRGLVEMPVTKTAQANIDDGSLLQPGSDGIPVFFDPSSDSVDQIVGRCVWRDTIASYPGTSGLSKVRTVPSFNLAGDNTDGAPGWLYGKSHEGGGNASDYLRVNITLLG